MTTESCPFYEGDLVRSRVNGLRGQVVSVNRRTGMVRLVWRLARRDTRGRRSAAAAAADVPADTLVFEPGAPQRRPPDGDGGEPIW